MFIDLLFLRFLSVIKQKLASESPARMHLMKAIRMLWQTLFRCNQFCIFWIVADDLFWSLIHSTFHFSVAFARLRHNVARHEDIYIKTYAVEFSSPADDGCHAFTRWICFQQQQSIRQSRTLRFWLNYTHRGFISSNERIQKSARIFRDD